MFNLLKNEQTGLNNTKGKCPDSSFSARNVFTQLTWINFTTFSYHCSLKCTILLQTYKKHWKFACLKVIHTYL